VSSAFDEIAIQGELADQWIDLSQAQRQLRVVFQVAAHEVVLAGAGFQSHGASVIGRSDAIFFRQRQHAQDAAHRGLAVLSVQLLTQCPDVLPCFFSAAE
jgi:hypothetical protein